MIKPATPKNEQARLNALKTYSILDTLPEQEYDDITLLASYITNTPVSLISLIDENRQWFKSKHGLRVESTPRDVAFCAHAINKQDEVMVVPDSRDDERFHDNPLVTGDPHVVFYAGVPLVNSEGHALGTLCVIDQKPRDLSSEQLNALKALSRQLMNLFELRKNKQITENLNAQLEQQNKGLQNFASTAAHDIKSPLSTIIMLSDLLKKEHSDKMTGEAKEVVDYIGDSSHKLIELIDGILEYSKNTSLIAGKKELINIRKLIHSVINWIDPEKKVVFRLDVENDLVVFSNKTALEQIFVNLLTNAIKYNDKAKAEIEVIIKTENSRFRGNIIDNGPGIPETETDRIFNIFQTTSLTDKSGSHGTGVGLATVKSLIEGLGGTISVTSRPGRGSNFEFSLDQYNPGLSTQ